LCPPHKTLRFDDAPSPRRAPARRCAFGIGQGIVSPHSRGGGGARVPSAAPCAPLPRPGRPASRDGQESPRRLCAGAARLPGGRRGPAGEPGANPLLRDDGTGPHPPHDVNLPPHLPSRPHPPQTSQAELSRTAVTQPALLAHSIAVYRVLEVRRDPRTRSPRPSRPLPHIPPLPPFLPTPPHPSPSSAARPSKEPCAASLATRWGSTRPSLRPAPSLSRTRPGSSVCAATACSGRRTRRRR
jgi:hypothetical protein